MQQYLRSLKKCIATVPNRVKYFTAIAGVFGILGLIWMQVSNAATSTQGYEAESGIRAGAAIEDTTKAGASGGKSVTFGAVQAAPINLAAFTGGDSIALVWDLPPGNIKETEIYRNDTKVASVVFNSGPTTSERIGTHYVDKSVTRGTAYTYKVRVINQAGVTSAFSTATSATHPKTVMTPVPTVSVDSSQAPDLANLLNNQAKPLIETWYPKMADALVYPDFVLNKPLKIIADNNYEGIAAVFGGDTIRLDPDWFRARPDETNPFIHELFHMIQAWGNNDTSGWFTEGSADWALEWMFRANRYKIETLSPSAKLTDGYTTTGMMIQWAQVKYSSTFVRKMMINIKKGVYNESMVTSITGGKTPQQLFDEARNQHYMNIGSLKHSSGKCVEVANASITEGTAVRLAACNNSNQQKWRQVYKDVGVSAGLKGETKTIAYIMNPSLSGAPNGRCIDVKSSGTASGTVTHSWPCDWGSVQRAQMWKIGTNGSLMNPNSGKCLDTVDGTSNDGVQLAIKDCNGSTNQSWTLPQ